MSFSFAKSGFSRIDNSEHCADPPLLKSLVYRTVHLSRRKTVEDLEWIDREFLLCITKLSGSFLYPRSWHETPETHVPVLSEATLSSPGHSSGASRTEHSNIIIRHVVNERWKSSKQEIAWWTGNPILATGSWDSYCHHWYFPFLAHSNKPSLQSSFEKVQVDVIRTS